jgi:hypothetical protein
MIQEIITLFLLSILLIPSVIGASYIIEGRRDVNITNNIINYILNGSGNVTTDGGNDYFLPVWINSTHLGNSNLMDDGNKIYTSLDIYPQYNQDLGGSSNRYEYIYGTTLNTDYITNDVGNIYLQPDSGTVQVYDRLSVNSQIQISGDYNEIKMFISRNPSQTFNLTEWRDENGTGIAYVDKDGGFYEKTGRVCTAENRLCFEGGLTRLFFYNETSPINGSYTIMNTTSSPTIQRSTFSGLPSGITQLTQRLYNGTFISISPGIYRQHTTINFTSGTKKMKIYSNIYILHSNNSEELIGTSVGSDELFNGVYQDVDWTGNIPGDHIMNDSQKVVMKLYANVYSTGSAPTIQVVTGGNTGASLEIGSALPDNGGSTTDSGWTSTGIKTYLTNTSGMIGIGTTTPKSTLDLTGNVSIRLNGNSTIGNMFFDTTNNKIAIGANTTTSATLYVVGEITSNYMTVTNYINSPSVQMAGAGSMYWYGRTQLFSPADGDIKLTDWNTGTTFGKMMFGGSTSAYPAIRRNSTDIDFILADQSNYTNIRLRNINSTGIITTKDINITNKIYMNNNTNKCVGESMLHLDPTGSYCLAQVFTSCITNNSLIFANMQNDTATRDIGVGSNGVSIMDRTAGIGFNITNPNAGGSGCSFENTKVAWFIIEPTG